LNIYNVTFLCSWSTAADASSSCSGNSGGKAPRKCNGRTERHSGRLSD